MLNYTELSNIFEQKWGTDLWFVEIIQYLVRRYFSIEERLIHTFRYVEPYSGNRYTFSYEYSSILRDTGSAFDSTMRKLLEGTLTIYSSNKKKPYNITDYRKFLIEHVPQEQSNFPLNIESVAVGLNLSYLSSENRFLIPFSSLGNDSKKKTDYDKIDWWDAYNNIKHSDIDHMADGNLANCLSSVAALGILHVLMNKESGRRIRLFSEIGQIEDAKMLLYLK